MKKFFEKGVVRVSGIVLVAAIICVIGMFWVTPTSTVSGMEHPTGKYFDFSPREKSSEVDVKKGNKSSISKWEAMIQRAELMKEEGEIDHIYIQIVIDGSPMSEVSEFMGVTYVEGKERTVEYISWIDVDGMYYSACSDSLNLLCTLSERFVAPARLYAEN